MALFVPLNFTRVTRTDGGERVSRHDARFQSGGMALEPEVVAFGWIAKAQPPEIARVKQALVPDVMQ